MTEDSVESVGTAKSVRHAAVKVPTITLIFWITKILTTGMGETFSDFLLMKWEIIGLAVGSVGLAVSFVLQFRASRYIVWIYWLAVVMVSIFGTMLADVIAFILHVPLLVSTLGFATVLGIVFYFWGRSEGTLAISSVRSRRAEGFYWATVMATFSLGTAAGDLTAYVFGWGFLVSGIVFSVVMAIPALMHQRGQASAIATFWFAYVLTRPVGASFADWMAVPADRGGLGLGALLVSAEWAVAIVLLVAYMALAKRANRTGTEPSGAH